MPAAKSRSSKAATKKASAKRPAKGKPAATKKKSPASAGAKKGLGSVAKKKGAGSKLLKVKKAAPASKKTVGKGAKKKAAPLVKMKSKAAPSKKQAAAPAKAKGKLPAKAAIKPEVKVKAATKPEVKLKAPKIVPLKADKSAVKEKPAKAPKEKASDAPKAPRLVVAKSEPAPAPTDNEQENQHKYEDKDDHKPAAEAAVDKAAVVKEKAPKPPKLTVVKNEEEPAEETPAKPSMMGMPVSTSAEPQLEGGVLVSPEVANEGMQLLCERYPDAQCELNYANAFQLLIAVILSAQTTDANVNRVTPTLFKKFPTPKALADADIDEIKGIIKSTGYFNSKAKSVQECARALAENFKGEVPDDVEKLTTLPGVGRKTANVVLGVIFDKPAWTVDTHVQRLSRRLGYSLETDPEKIEQDLQKLFPESDWTKYSITLIWHGRRCCFARNPNCAECPVNKLCPSSRVK